MTDSVTLNNHPAPSLVPSHQILIRPHEQPPRLGLGRRGELQFSQHPRPPTNPSRPPECSPRYARQHCPDGPPRAPEKIENGQDDAHQHPKPLLPAEGHHHLRNLLGRNPKAQGQVKVGLHVRLRAQAQLLRVLSTSLCHLQGQELRGGQLPQLRLPGRTRHDH
jgi:hypothetical protein